MSLRTRTGSGLAVLALTATILVAVTTSSTNRAEAWTPQNGVNAAASFATSRGYTTAVTVMDTWHGTYWGAGSQDTYFASESLVKLFIATRLIISGQIKDPVVNDMAFRMIARSDDPAANALYSRALGDGVIDWVKAFYNIPSLGTRPSQPGWWGNTKVTARGLVQFYTKVRKDTRVWPWLGRAMHAATPYGSDGVYQFFGIPSATTGFGVKQGWGNDENCVCTANFHSTGIVNGDRYAVAILTRGPSSTYGSAISSVQTGQARALMPYGYINPAERNPIGGTVVTVKGSTVTLTGWALDPDARTKSVLVAAFDWHGQRGSKYTDLLRADINTKYNTSGNHGFAFSFASPNGVRRICARLYNIAAGDANPMICRDVTVDGSPGGRFEGLTAATPTSVRLVGWGFDNDATATSIDVSVTMDGVAKGTFPANLPRPDVNSTYKITGNHGFDITLPATSGSHSVCVTLVNIGPPAPNRVLPCRAIVVGSPTPTGSTTPPAPPAAPASAPAASSASPTN